MKVGGEFIVDANNFLANESGVQPELGEWYSIKLVAEGNRYELHLGKQGEELKLACKWTDKTHKSRQTHRQVERDRETERWRK